MADIDLRAFHDELTCGVFLGRSCDCGLNDAVEAIVRKAVNEVPERRIYMDVQRWLDTILGDKEDDGSGEGLLSDLAYAFEVAKRQAANDAIAAYFRARRT